MRTRRLISLFIATSSLMLIPADRIDGPPSDLLTLTAAEVRQSVNFLQTYIKTPPQNPLEMKTCLATKRDLAITAHFTGEAGDEAREALQGIQKRLNKDICSL